MGAAIPSHALLLGKHRGAAVIGQPLNVGISATVENPDELGAGCLGAEVFYADNRLETSKVRVSSEKTGTGPRDALIRVRTTVPIDEPVVTIYLRTGCAQKIEKRYVILSDILSESAAGGGVALPSVPGQVGTTAAGLPDSSQSGSASAASSARATALEAQRLRREAQRADKKTAADARKLARNSALANQPGAAMEMPAGPAADVATARAEKKTTPAIAKATTPEKSKARLKLEPVELLAERDPTLKQSVELRTVPTNDPAQRSAAAALWRAIAAQPEDILGDSQKLKSLESAVSGLQVQMKKNELDMQALSGDIQQARTEKYANPLVYGLSFLLFLAALGLAVMFRRRAAEGNTQAFSQPWWRKGSGGQVGWVDSGLSREPSVLTGASGFQGDAPASSNSYLAPSADYLDLDLSDASSKPARNWGGFGQEESSLLGSSSGGGRAQSKDEVTVNLRADFALSMAHSGRAVKAEELFDVQQQADFFVSLGQKDQAVEVLRSHIEESEETSALVYLDLLKLYHQLGERLEFEAFRQEFNAKFNAEIPEFDSYDEAASGEGLQGYPLAMSRIAALWPSAKVLTVIEESMFREPDSQTPTFDLEAYRELLLLYAMIKDILHAQSIGSGPTVPVVPPRTDRRRQSEIVAGAQPQLTALQERASSFPATAVVPLAATPGTRARDIELGVDVDLSSLGRLESAKVGHSNEQPQVSLKGDSDTAPAGPAVSTKADFANLENSIDFDFSQPASIELTPPKPATRTIGKKG